ncbi:uncharacterized protein LOC142767533 [Rhipicephalus microplus]|uniref:uncharacterized protein LOC142767533 n=1 Tax=Rhipicephalus microplus TaxID=6941 RepID=UPI003F6B0422
MAYRQHIALEIVSSRKTHEGASATTSPAEAPPTTGQEASQKPKDATPTVPSDSEHMASDLYVASERTKRGAESPSDWRNFSLGDESGGNKKSKKKRSARKPVQETGTLHVSRNLSSVRRLARRDQQVPPKPTKAGPAAMIISKPRPLLQEANRHRVLAPSDKVVPDKGDYKFGDSFEDLDMVADSAALPAPASSAEAQNKKAVAQRPVVRPVEEHHHNLPPLLWYQYLARGHKPAHLGVPSRLTRNAPVTTKPPATAPTAVAAAAATTSPVHVEASGAPRVEKWVAAANREAAHQGKARQAASGHPNIASRASRKRSSSQRSSMSSRKTSFGSDTQSVATARRATKKESPSATSSKAPVFEAVLPAAATLGKSSQGKRRRMSKLSHEQQQSGEERESPRLKSTSDHELDRRPSGLNESAQPAPLASDVSSTKGPSGTGAETGKFKQATPVQPVVPGEMHLAAPPASGALKSPIQGTEEVPGHLGTKAPTSAVPAPREEESKDVPSSHVHQLDYGIATTANQPDTLDVNKPPTDKPARLLHNLAVGLKRRSHRRRLTRKSLDSNQDVDDMAALRATDISVVSGESCPLDRGSSASISLGSALGVVTSQTATIHAVQAVSGPSAPQKEASAGQPSAPPPAIVALKSVSQTSAKTTSSGTQHSVSSKELERSTAAATAGVEARDETRWENADHAGASSPKESRGTSGKGNVHPRHRSRRSPKKQRHTSSSDHSVEHHGSDSPH